MLASMPAYDEISIRLKSRLTEELSNNQIELDVETEERFEKLIKKAANNINLKTERYKLRKSTGQKKNDIQIDRFSKRITVQSEEKLAIIVSRMANEAKKNEEYIINIQIYNQVLSGICPIWPFC